MKRKHHQHGMNALSAYQIGKFFRDSNRFSLETCNKIEASIESDGIITPTDTQGLQSCALRVSNGTSHFNVQFRDPSYDLDLDIQGTAKETYWPLVPNCELAQGQLHLFHMCKLTDIPGDTFLAGSSVLYLHDNSHLLSWMIEDFAAYFVPTLAKLLI